MNNLNGLLKSNSKWLLFSSYQTGVLEHHLTQVSLVIRRLYQNY
jgi:hypothetical protein